MVHRDIKPANLILTRDGDRAVVKAIDFGLAKVTSEGESESHLTRQGQMLGTPDYIAPEQIRNAQSADIRADIYSLGCTLYYLLSGGPPFPWRSSLGRIPGPFFDGRPSPQSDPPRDLRRVGVRGRQDDGQGAGPEVSNSRASGAGISRVGEQGTRMLPSS